MKVLILLTATFLTVCGVTINEQWSDFKVKHGKSYSNVIEEKQRYKIFKENLNKITEHNAKYQEGKSKYYMGINKFGDMTEKEFSEMLLRQIPTKPNIKKTYKILPQNLNVPDSMDWREKGAVLEVGDQGNCGSCWAFSATGALEGQNAIVNNVSITLSTQELMDCSYLYGNRGCSGGQMRFAFDYVEDFGIHSESSYPYTAKSNLRSCKQMDSDVILKVKNYYIVDREENALKTAIATVGPISVTIDATSLQFYEGGVFDDENCLNYSGSLNHGVLAIGYGTESETDFWLVKNSWSKTWGENGYFKLHRNSSICGILLDSSYPVLV